MQNKLTKILFILFSFIGSIGFATITVDWTMPDLADIVLRSDNVTPLPENSVWQLIWSPDEVISPFNSLNPFEVDSSELLLDEVRNSAAIDGVPGTGFIFDRGGSYGSSADTLVGGYVYTRVFDYQGSTSSFNLIDLDGMFYAESSSFEGPLNDTDTDPGPSAGDPNLHVPFTGTNVVDQTFTIIPEPTTMAVLLMGILGLVGFRKHLRK
ncbi:PEP-CTERM sorting domain-containing protein [Kiritimatiellaeota bacterium B1221]|nr:PEP-CTERM sorting domain-containing protein [Kiritimatiellaeota bacterium B1221]